MSPLTLPTEFKWLADEPMPAFFKTALSYHGMQEIVGAKHNPVILGMAKALNPLAGAWYDSDEKAWCGVFEGFCLKTNGEAIPDGYDAMRARSYANVGVAQRQAMLFDILVFDRDGGAHVTNYVGEDAKRFWCYGGNQKNGVCIVPIEKDRIIAIRRLQSVIDDHRLNVRRVMVTAAGAASKNEA